VPGSTIPQARPHPSSSSARSRLMRPSIPCSAPACRGCRRSSPTTQSRSIRRGCSGRRGGKGLGRLHSLEGEVGIIGVGGVLRHADDLESAANANCSAASSLSRPVVRAAAGELTTCRRRRPPTSRLRWQFPVDELRGDLPALNVALRLQCSGCGSPAIKTVPQWVRGRRESLDS
jgi:hypothetical protein